MLRGTLLAPLSQLLQLLEPALRERSGGSAWVVASPANGCAVGELLLVPDLASAQRLVYDKPTVLLAERVGGEEEVPEGVVALLTGAGVDVLSHCAVRARNAGVLLATCYDEGTLAGVKAMAGQWVKVRACVLYCYLQGGAVLVGAECKAIGSRGGSCVCFGAIAHSLRFQVRGPKV